jgi:hypothetical protein
MSQEVTNGSHITWIDRFTESLDQWFAPSAEMQDKRIEGVQLLRQVNSEIVNANKLGKSELSQVERERLDKKPNSLGQSKTRVITGLNELGWNRKNPDSPDV